MGKLSVTIDASKAKQLVETREYTDKEGKKVTVKEIKFDLVEMKPESQKVLKDTDTFELVKTHFAVKQQTKEERASKADPVFVGEGITIKFKDTPNSGAASSAAEDSSSEEEDDLPF